MLRGFRLTLAAASITVAGVLASCGGSAPPTAFLSIATGGTGGVYYPYGGALARLITAGIPNTQATAEVTGASIDNLKLIQQGKADIAFVLADTLKAAVDGTGPFSGNAIPSLRALAPLYTNYTHVIVRAGLGAASIADLGGKTVSVGAPGSGTELIADRVLAAAGIDPRTGITRHALGVAESVGAIKDGKIDAFFWSGGVPTPSVQDLAATPGMRIALIGHDALVPLLQRDFGAGLYTLAVIPSGTYRGVDRDVSTAGVQNLLVASTALDDATAREIVRILFERKADLVAAHPEARHLERPATFDRAPAPYHPGALAYYKSSQK